MTLYVWALLAGGMQDHGGTYGTGCDIGEKLPQAIRHPGERRTRRQCVMEMVLVVGSLSLVLGLM